MANQKIKWGKSTEWAFKKNAANMIHLAEKVLEKQANQLENLEQLPKNRQ